MRVDQLIGSYRMSLMAVVESAPSIRQGCRNAGIHPSTFYDWRNRLDRHGPEGLLVRASRTRVKSHARVRLEAEVVALSLANPGWGPDRLFYELQQRQVPIGSVSQAWRILGAHHLNTRALRYRLIAVTQGLTIGEATGLGLPHQGRSKPRVGVLHADKPGDLVQLDCFQIGRLKRPGSDRDGNRPWCGSTPRSMSPRRSRGPRCTPQHTTPQRSTPPRSRVPTKKTILTVPTTSGLTGS